MSDEILKEFQSESKNLIENLLQILEECEGHFDQVQRLGEYGQKVDRIMGGAQSIGLTINDPSHFIHKVGDYSAICKAVGYKASQITDNEEFYEICVALLLDATETLNEMVDFLLDEEAKDMKDIVSQTFLDRLNWVSAQFGAEYSASVSVQKTEGKMSQEEIDGLLKKLGLG